MKRYLLSASLFLALLVVLPACRNTDADEPIDVPGGTASDVIPPYTAANADGAAGAVDGSFTDESASGWNESIDPTDPNSWQRINDPNLKIPTIYFAYDSDALGSRYTEELDNLAAYLMQPQSATIGIIIEAHSDERGTEEYNRALSERRALSVKDYLVGKGVDAARFHTVGYGEERPAVEGTGESVWMKNRRAELVPARMK